MIPHWDGSLRKLLADEFGLLANQTHSAIMDSRFLGLNSNKSAIHASDSVLLINGTEFNSNWGPEATGSSTVSLARTNLTLNNTWFINNTADIGACLQANDRSHLMV